MPSTEGEYKGKPVIMLTPKTKDGYQVPFVLGLHKARLAIENYDAIVDFYLKNNKGKI